MDYDDIDFNIDDLNEAEYPPAFFRGLVNGILLSIPLWMILITIVYLFMKYI